MIQANELMIGNYVKYIFSENDFSIVKGISEEYIFLDEITGDYPSANDIEPIPITEKWLLRFGFEKTSLHYFKKDGVILSFEDYFYECFLGNKSVVINHVHQLQNLYFALTGKELEIK